MSLSVSRNFGRILLLSASLLACGCSSGEIKQNSSLPQVSRAQEQEAAAQESYADSESVDSEASVISGSESGGGNIDNAEKPAGVQPLNSTADGHIRLLTYLPEEQTAADISLFEEMGGEVEIVRCGEGEFFDRLASERAAASGIDAADYLPLAFPYGCVEGYFQPLDLIVDFEKELWSGVSDIASEGVMNGFYYLAPCSVQPKTLFYYEEQKAQQLGLGDPQQLLASGEWTMQAWQDMVTAFSGEGQYGVGGEWGAAERAIFLSTGEPLVLRDEDYHGFINNIFAPKLSAAAQTLYTLKEEGVFASGEFTPNDCLQSGLLFVAASAQYYDSRPEGVAAVLPPVSDDGCCYAQAEIRSYMWVSGSDKSEAVGCLLECSRQNALQQDTDFECSYIFDVSDGISPQLNNASDNEDFGLGVVTFVYSAPSESGEWDSICGYFTNRITGALSDLNNKYNEEVYG